MPTIFDHALVFFIALVWPLYAGLVQFPRLKRGVADGIPGVRSRTYTRAILVQWIVATYALVVWILARRPAGDLGFALVGGWRLALGVVFVVAAIVFLEMQRRRVTRDSELQVEFRKKVEHATPVLPTDAKELFLFHLVSVTAGICEELLYRGFLIWYIAQGLGFGLIAGVALSSALFGFAHLYQGPKGVLQTGTVGLVLAVVYVATGALWAPMLLHAVVDMSSGILWYQVRERLVRDTAPAPVEPSGGDVS
jgi:membrane protease YdiL (CAAX protease family)